MLVLRLENKIRHTVTSYFLTGLLEDGYHSNQGPADRAGGGELEGIVLKKSKSLDFGAGKGCEGPCGRILPHVPKKVQRSHTDRNHNKYPGKIPHGPQRKVRQGGHFLVLSREMLGNLPVTTSNTEEGVRPAYAAERTHPQPFRWAQRWSSQHHVSPGEQAIQSSKVTANEAEPHPCTARTVSWTLSLRGPGHTGAVVR